MEAVPRLSMISCELKLSPSNTEFGPTLLKFIREQYNEDPESYKKEIKELELLRQTAIKPPRDYTGCSTLKRYYAQLHFLQSRFPMTDDGAACVPFTWTDIYTQMIFSITDIEYEQACILYNIGALHSELGAMDTRANAEGMKIACTHFQCAAFAFHHLRDTYPQPKGSDMSHDLLSFFMNIMLAQAQECILEKSMLDSRKASITAKVAAQVVEYYRCAVGVLVSGSPSSDAGCITDVVGSKLAKEWKKFIQFKMSYYKSISHLYMGNQADEQQKMGERVAWYQSASEALNEAIKIAKSMDRSELNEALTFTMDVIGGKHSNSKKENDFVYHEKVPAVESLPEVHRASLVKGIPFSHTDPDVCGQDIFARLVPMEAHEAASLYSEEKAKILRSFGGKMEDKDQELTAFLSSLQLDKDDLSLEPEVIPQELLERCAAMSVRPTAISDLNEVIKELMDTRKNVEICLKKCCDLLLEEKQKELKHQAECGSRLPSLIIVELNKECAKYDEARVKAAESNEKLQHAANHHMDSLKLLCQPLEEIGKMLPSVSSVKSTPLHEKATKELHRLLDRVDEMRKQRESLEQQLRESLQKDDITEILITQGKKDDLQKTFQDELKKHDQLLMYFDQNLAAQDNILCALTQANAQYAETRKAIMETKKQREAMVQSIINSFDVYEDVKQKADKGLEFYHKLNVSVTRLLARIRSVTHVQDEERDQVFEAQMKKGVTLGKGKHFSANSPLPVSKAFAAKLANEPDTLTQRPLNYSQMPTDTVQIPKAYQSCTPVPNRSVEQMSFPPRKPESNISHSTQVKYRSEITPIGENTEFSATSVRPPPVGSETTTVPEMCSVTPHPIRSSTHHALHDHMFWGSSVPSGCEYSPVYNTGPYSVAGSPQQVSSKSGIVSQGFHSSSLTPTNQFPVQVTVPSQRCATTAHATDVTPAFNQVASDRSYHIPPYAGTYAVNASQVYSPSLSSPYSSSSSHSSSSVPFTPVSVPYDQGTLYAGYHYNGTSGSLPYMTPGTLSSGPNTFSTNTSSTPISQNCLYSYPSISTQTKSMSYEAYSSVPIQGNTSSPLPSTQYSMANIASNSTGVTNYPYSAQGWTQMYPYSQQSNMMPVSTTSYPEPLQQPAEASSQWTQPGQYSNVSPQQQNYVAPWSQTAPAMSYPVQPASPVISQVAGGLTGVAETMFVPLHKNSDSAPFANVPTTVPMNMEPMLPKSTGQLHLETKIEPVQPKTAGEPHMEIVHNGTSALPKDVRFSSSSSDLLSGPTEATSQQMDPKVLQPKIADVVDAKPISESKEKDKSGPPKDPLDDSIVREKFISEVEKYEKFVDGLLRKSLNGTTPLDQKWKEFTDAQDKESRKTSISIARCYPLKNRYPDIMPYDNNRVKLSMVKNDYINASYLKGLFPSSPVFVNTQAPLPATYADFWTMIWEEQVETLACLLSSSELKNHFYWPKEKNQSLQFGVLNVTLQNQLEKKCSMEYRISLTHSENRISRVVILLQFTAWPSSGVPSSPSQFLQFVTEVLNYHKQQRSLQRPVIVHCSAGVGRSGVFCLVSAFVTDLRTGHGPTDIVHVVARMSQQRKFLIQEKDQLKFCYDAVLYYAQDLLMKRGILTNRASFEDKLPGSGGTSSHSRHPSEDFILGSGGLAKLQSGMAKMGLSDQQNNSVPCCDSFPSSKEEKEQQGDVPLVSKPTDCAEVKDGAKLSTNNISSSVSEVSNTAEHQQSVSQNEPIVTSDVPNPFITNILDPSNFTLETTTSSPVKRRITKESFINPTGSLANPVTDSADPLSQLDPLWSLKRNNV